MEEAEKEGGDEKRARQAEVPCEQEQEVAAKGEFLTEIAGEILGGEPSPLGGCERATLPMEGNEEPKSTGHQKENRCNAEAAQKEPTALAEAEAQSVGRKAVANEKAVIQYEQADGGGERDQNAGELGEQSMTRKKGPGDHGKEPEEHGDGEKNREGAEREAAGSFQARSDGPSGRVQRRGGLGAREAGARSFAGRAGARTADVSQLWLMILFDGAEQGFRLPRVFWVGIIGSGTSGHKRRNGWVRAMGKRPAGEAPLPSQVADAGSPTPALA